MGTLVVDRRKMELRYDSGRVAIYESGRRAKAVPIRLIDRLVVYRQALVDTRIVSALARQGGALIVVDLRNRRGSACLVGSSHNDAGRRLAQCSAALDQQWRSAWSAALVRRKIRSQLRLMRRARDQRPDRRRSLTSACSTLENALDALGGEASQSRSRIRGVEGAAAAAYFIGLRSLFAPSLNFTGRNRRPPKDPVNACLSLSYSIIHAEAVHAIAASGLDPFVGFYHDLAFGRESLACDLVEPLRPVADEFVWTLFRQRVLRPESFSFHKSPGGGCLLGKAGRRAFYSARETIAEAWRKRLRRSAQVVVRAISRRDSFLPRSEP